MSKNLLSEVYGMDGGRVSFLRGRAGVPNLAYISKLPSIPFPPIVVSCGDLWGRFRERVVTVQATSVLPRLVKQIDAAIWVLGKTTFADPPQCLGRSWSSCVCLWSCPFSTLKHAQCLWCTIFLWLFWCTRQRKRANHIAKDDVPWDRIFQRVSGAMLDITIRMFGNGNGDSRWRKHFFPDMFGCQKCQKNGFKHIASSKTMVQFLFCCCIGSCVWGYVLTLTT